MAALGKSRIIQPSQTAERQVDSTNRDVRQALGGVDQNIALVNAHANALTPSFMPIDGFTDYYWSLGEPLGSLAAGQAIAGKNFPLIFSSAAIPGQLSELGGLALRLFDDATIANARAQSAAVPTPVYRTASLSLWVWTGNASAGAGFRHLFSHKPSGAGSPHLGLLVNQLASGALVFQATVMIGAAGLACNAPGDAYVTAGAWHHLGLTANGTILALYVDGRPISSTPAAGNIDWTTGGASVWTLGYNGTVGAFPGFYQDVMVSAAARPREWFEEAYLRGKGRFF
jgi:hypothetical protein